VWRGSFGGCAWGNMSTALRRAKVHSLGLRPIAEESRQGTNNFDSRQIGVVLRRRRPLEENFAIYLERAAASALRRLLRLRPSRCN
jgi:hypothetical protein